MKNTIIYIISLLYVAASFTGCTAIGDKTASLCVIYGAAAIISLILLTVYFVCFRQKDVWFTLLFTSVSVVNIGYFCLSVSKTLEEALLANRIAYLGSVLLPLSMLLIIINTANLNYPRWLPGCLIGIGIAVFIVAASPGYLDIYYKEVTLVIENGVTHLKKVYGSWHVVYLIYLMGYFMAMISAIIHSYIKKRITSLTHTVILATAVLVNIGVWLMEQLVDMDFEMLSVSYIISEIFLLGLHMMVIENKRLKDMVTKSNAVTEPDNDTEQIIPSSSHHTSDEDAENNSRSNDFNEKHHIFIIGHSQLTPTERLIFDRYIMGKTTKEIMADLNIKENTLKFHNKNIYCKLGVSSRKQLIEIAGQIDSKTL